VVATIDYYGFHDSILQVSKCDLSVYGNIFPFLESEMCQWKKEVKMAMSAALSI
jgi:hypothetical protein